MTLNGNGYQLPERQARLVFEDEYAGAEISVRLGTSMRDFLSLQRLMDSNEADDIERAMQEFSDRILISWNLKDADGAPVPLSLLDVPVDFAKHIIAQYVQAVPRIPLAAGTSGE